MVDEQPPTPGGTPPPSPATPPPAPPPPPAATPPVATSPPPPPPCKQQRPWQPWHTFTLLAILVAMGLIGWLIPARSGSLSLTQMGHNRLISWLITAALMIAFIAIAGDGVTGLWRGLLIDNRNKMSLARFQLVIWVVIVLSGFLTGALWNVARHAAGDNLAIAIPTELWQILGISTASLVGSTLVLTTKAQNETVSQGQLDRTTTTLANQENLPRIPTNRGVVVVKSCPEDAHWVDMFKGEETGNAAYLDLGKVQMFFFTLIIAFAFATKLAALFNTVAAANAAFTSFPPLDPSMVTLLGISHAGYLGYKAAPHSDPSPSDPVQ